ncbi:hypothetical protein [Streptomyces roseolilacinus]|uniref:Uncharacterized protein n=1 Tax=Streptomyces roseolilacinus TaxID=66904 RepID=A0A918B5H6_9ACTN|nr:hypothetical protein [Streptomyces roseolilacinus]GGQ29856.1 hypothetical protein GCM10010249_55790 [Streptomyces roseolilacinus]
MSGDTRDERFKVGDVLLVSCPSARARVVHVTSCEVSVEWPWAHVDPDSEIQWNGHRAIPRTTTADEWGGLFRVSPPAGDLKAGDSCLVGIPETLVRIIDIGRFDPPADVGWLPRPHTMVIVLPVDHPHDPHSEEEGDTIDLEAAAPLRIDLVSRG